MITIRPVSRSCNGCTKCCEGWLSGTAYGYSFSPYKKCAFLKNGCGIYQVRPMDPCKTFECEWKSNNIFPDWLKPDQSHVIILKRKFENKYYYLLYSTGRLLDQKIFTWADEFSKSTKHNIVVKNEQEYSVYSADDEFVKLAKEQLNIGV
jgi:hypothetical protein